MPEIKIDTFDELSEKAYDYLNEQQEICRNTYKTESYQRWYYKQETGLLSFSDDGVDKLLIDFEKVGTISLKSNTWLWAWDNSTTLPKVKSEIIKIKEYGQLTKLDKLVMPTWEADEADGWEMTAIACYLLQAKGAYRAPLSEDEQLFSYMIFKNIRFADNSQHL